MRLKAFWRGARRAAADRRGGIAVTAALSMLPISMLAFAAVEFHNYTTQRTTLQNALDAAALAVARAPASATQADLRHIYITVLKSHLTLTPGLLTLVESAADPTTGQAAQPELTYVNGEVTTRATLAISPIIASFFVSGDLKVTTSSKVLRESRGLEVALVLDTTGSMNTVTASGLSRMEIAKTAATNFVTALERATTNTSTPNAVRIGVVPFSGAVNVGSTYQSASWIDAAGASPISKEIFSDPQGNLLAFQTNRFTLLNNLGITWGGCVESRAYPYDVQDTAPNPNTPATLFVPYFAPDEPDYLPVGAPAKYDMGRTNWRAEHALQVNAVSNSYLWDMKRAVQLSRRSTAGDQLLGSHWSGYPVNLNSPDYIADFSNHTKSYFGALGIRTKYFGTELDAEINDPFYKINDGFSRTNNVRGPNQGCTMKPVTRLTNNYTSVKTAISQLSAAGDTNIPMGLMWGWHLLSPSAPFSDGSAYGTAGTTKVVVLLTDGDNAIDGWDYTGVGYAFQNRLGTTATDTASLGAALNRRMAELCVNMKARGIVLYTMRVEQLTGDPSVMRTCATTSDMFFDVRNAADLDATFRNIARSVQNLRIAS